MSVKQIVLAVVLSCILAVGCATKQKPPQAIQPRLLGTVALVNDTERFVLVDVGTLYSPAEGVALKSFAPDGKETGVLAVSRERKPPFVVADIVQGAPQKGDRVYE